MYEWGDCDHINGVCYEMNEEMYPKETLSPYEDNGTMPENVDELAEKVVGHRIVKAEKVEDLADSYGYTGEGLVITLDDGTKVQLVSTYDCCAHTDLEAFLLHPEMVDHIITGVGTTDEYSTWHIFADAGDVLELTVSWSCGNPFYYGYGFDINVVPVKA